MTHPATQPDADTTRLHTTQRRLVVALSGSLLLHGLLLLVPVPYRSAARYEPPRILLAYLKQDPPPTPPRTPQPQHEEKRIEAPRQTPQTSGASATPEHALRSPPRFAEAPDFSALEALPAAGRSRVHLRIYVSAAGHVDRIEIVENESGSGEFLALAYEAIAQARITPGIGINGPTAGVFEVVIGAAAPSVRSGR